MFRERTKMQEFLQAVQIPGIESAVDGIQYLSACEPREIKVTDETKIVKTSCRGCIANCGVLAHVKNGRVVKLEGNPVDPMSKGRLCAKGLSGMQALYHPNRNKYPLQRVGERGGNRWRRIPWDQALTTIAEKLMDTKEKYGEEAVFC